MSLPRTITAITLLSSFPSLLTGEEITLYDFDANSNSPRWLAENDGVMGGVSEGAGKIKGGNLIFRGKLSLENNGGFASLQTEDGKWDLSKSRAVRLRVKGDGRSYQFRVATSARFNGSKIDYTAEFNTEANRWIEVLVPFSKMKPVWRGRTLDGPELDLKNVEQLRILVGDKKEGPFLLEVDWIRAS